MDSGENMKKQPLVILTGPTAVGKTALSVELARSINAEIISADSMQVYRYMDIGSAKIREEEKCGIRHHLIDILGPKESFDVTVFRDMAVSAIEDIISRGRLPLVVGGTGFYIHALLYDIDFNDKAHDPGLRHMLEAEAGRKGSAAMYERLLAIDPESALAIPPGNLKRVIRALEFYELTGEKISEHNKRERAKDAAYNFAYFVLTDERKKLYDRINERVDMMMSEGLVGEVRSLIDMGVREDDTSMQGIGYREVYGYLTDQGGISDIGAVTDEIKKNTRHFAKRQLTWFRREKDVIWIDKGRFGYDDDRILDFMVQSLVKKEILKG